jgi:chloride channel protein, CIC family
VRVASLKRQLAYAAAMIAVGVAAGLFGIAFRGGLGLAFRALFHEPDVLSAFEHAPVVWRVVLPTLGGALAASLGVVASRGAGGHGVAEILEAVVLGRGRISLRTALWKAAASFIAIVSGGSIGREGPLLQVGAAAGFDVAARAGLTPRRVRALVAAGTAAGFASAYNTPIAAVLFVVEVITGIVSLEVVLPIIVATAISTWMTRAALGPGPLYGPRTFSLLSGRELVAYAVLGVLTGVVASAFMDALARGARTFARVAAPAPVRGALGGLVVGLLAMRLPPITGNGYEVIQQMLDGRYGVAMLGVLLVAKLVATTASVSSGSPGGVFTPSLFLGAATGGLVGAAVAAIVPAHGLAGGYVLVGMAGAIAATTHAPIMATVLGFELAGDYGVVLPLFIATILATLVSRRLRRDSIYTEELRRRGIPWETNLEQRIASVVRARDILEMDPPALDAAAPVQAALDLLARSRARVVFVTGGPTVRAIDLHGAAAIWNDAGPGALGRTTSCGAVAVAVPTATPDDSLLTLSEKLFEIDWGELPIVDADQPGRLVGVVSRRTLLATFDRELLQRDSLSTRVAWHEGQTETADFLELPPGHRVEIIAPPRAAVGRPVDVNGLRTREHVNLMAVRRFTATHRGEWTDAAAFPDDVRADDRWMVVGAAAAIDHLRTGEPGQDSRRG